ncbi:uncharacterized protein PAC_11944 [Phialocephala subalpina]|uniref:Uncharacterized protein n=1 Tax=Phialocephala subalpina TaxID=576137 RepID=A0A1L7XAP8_9HELO|nr:uncharacterized protein PAC_11944 [Phialocephala subalpina]
MAKLPVAVNSGLCVPQPTSDDSNDQNSSEKLISLEENSAVNEIDPGTTTLPLDCTVHRHRRHPGNWLANSNCKRTAEKARENCLHRTIQAFYCPKARQGDVGGPSSYCTGTKSSLDEYLSLCCTEPVVLAHDVNLWFFSRPELVRDEKGRLLPAYTDKHINIAIFEMIHNAAASAAIWNYIYRLHQLLADGPGGPNDKLHRGLFKRHVQSDSGSKYFKRISGKYDNNVARVAMKGDLETLTKQNPQLHYMLRLCQPETDTSRAVAWVKNPDELHQAHPSARDEMQERGWAIFTDLAVIVSFVQSLSVSLPLPTTNLKRGQIHASTSKEFADELTLLKTEIDLSTFVIPINNILEPGIAEGVLSTLDSFIVDKTGTTMGYLYQDLIQDCVSRLQEHYQKSKEQLGKQAKPEMQVPVIEPEPAELRIQQRRQKDKTRPPHSSVYDTNPQSTSRP